MTFNFNTYAYKTIEASGRINSFSGKYDINESTILTKLIQDAGRFCEHYASDLFIDWNDVLRFCDANTGNEAKKMFLFGFRQNGVDSESAVKNNFMTNDTMARYKYRALWRLDVETNGDEIRMEAGRVF